MRTFKTLLGISFLIAAQHNASGFTFETIDHPSVAGPTYLTAVDGGNIVGYYQDPGIYTKSYGFLYNSGNFTAIGAPAISELQPTGISGNKVVGGGMYLVTGSPELGFIYDINTNSYSTLTGGANVPYSFFPIASGISGSTIVGYAGQANGSYWRKHSFTTIDGMNYSAQIDYPDPLSFYEGIALSTQAYGISGSTVVGAYLIPDHNPLLGSSAYHGFIYDNGSWSTIDAPAAINTYAHGIYGKYIVGYFNDNIGTHGFLYDGTNYLVLDVPGATSTQAFGISGNTIVGSYVDASGVTHGFITTLHITTTIDQTDSRVTGGGSLNFQGGTLLPTGTGTLNITNGIDVITASNGTIDASNSNISVSGNIDIQGSNFTLKGTSSSTITLSGTISGPGIIVNESGNNTLSGTNTYTGGTTVSAGTLTLAHATNTLADTGAVTVSGGILDIGANSDTVGELIISSGSITGTSGTLTGSSYTATNTTGTTTISANLGGSAALTKTGNGTLTLSGDNTYVGVTTIDAGKLVVSSLGDGVSASSLGTAGLAPANLVLAKDVTLGYAGAGETSGRGFTMASSATIDASGAGALAFSSAAKVAFSNSTSARTLTLTGTNTGANIFGAGLLIGATLDEDKVSQVVKDGVGTWIIANGEALKSSAQVDITAGILGVISQVLRAGNVVTLSNTSMLRWEPGDTDDLSPYIHLASGAAATLDVGANNLTFTQSLAFDGGSAASLTKTGTGTLTLVASNSGITGGFILNQGGVNVISATGLGSGTTVVNGGVLSVNAATTNNVTVNNSGTIGGSGTIATLSVTSGGHVSPGNSYATLTVSTATTLAGGAVIEWQVLDALDSTKFDYINFGTLDLSGASHTDPIIFKVISLDGISGNPLNFSSDDILSFSLGTIAALNLGTNANINDVFRFDLSQFTYTEGTLSTAGLWSMRYDSGSGALILTAVPEPSTYGLSLGALALVGAVIRRRNKTLKGERQAKGQGEGWLGERRRAGGRGGRRV